MKLRFDNIHPWSVEPIRHEYHISDKAPDWTLVMPVYNKESIIAEILTSACSNAHLWHDIILINDGSSDTTMNQLHGFIAKLSSCSYKISRITIFDIQFPIFETACDNLGFTEARTDSIIEIQSDLYIRDPGYDLKLISLLKTGKFASVGGRLVHDFGFLVGCSGWFNFPVDRIKRRIIGSVPEGEGLLGRKIFETSKLNLDSGAYFTGETVARGPWALQKSVLCDLNYLDQENYFLGYDDHDFHFRCFRKNGTICAYLPLNIFCLPEDGSTRQVRSGTNELIFQYFKENRVCSNEFKSFLKSYRPYAPITRIALT